MTAHAVNGILRGTVAELARQVPALLALIGLVIYGGYIVGKKLDGVAAAIAETARANNVVLTDLNRTLGANNVVLGVVSRQLESLERRSP